MKKCDGLVGLSDFGGVSENQHKSHASDGRTCEEKDKKTRNDFQQINKSMCTSSSSSINGTK